MRASDVAVLLRNFIRGLKWRREGVQFGWRSLLRVDSTACLSIGRGGDFRKAKLILGKKASLTVGRNARIVGTIAVDDNCQLEIGENFKLIDADLMIGGGGQAHFGNDCLLASVAPYKCAVTIDGGVFRAGDNDNIRGRVMVTGGVMTIGSNSFINHGTEVRCEHGVTVGEYVFISYFVDIHDTNTHSTEWSSRRQEVIDGYPNSTHRGLQKPKTSPIKIGDDVWIGKGAAVLKGVNLGARSIVGTRAVVTISCPPDGLLVGNPATCIQRSTNNREKNTI